MDKREEILKKHWQKRYGCEFNNYDKSIFKKNFNDISLAAMEEYASLKTAELEGSRWISVEDRLPEIESIVLTYGDDGVVRETKYTTYQNGSIGYSEGRKEKWFEYITHNNYCWQHTGVTHWQPLPASPDIKKL